MSPCSFQTLGSLQLLASSTLLIRSCISYHRCQFPENHQLQLFMIQKNFYGKHTYMYYAHTHTHLRTAILNLSLSNLTYLALVLDSSLSRSLPLLDTNIKLSKIHVYTHIHRLNLEVLTVSLQQFVSRVLSGSTYVAQSHHQMSSSFSCTVQ